jgi:hypothetical protein
MAETNWEPRIEREIEGIRWILRRDNVDTGLLYKAATSIEMQIRQLISDVELKTREDIWKEQNKK